MEFLLNQKKPDIYEFNLGNGEGFSVKEVISEVKKLADSEGRLIQIEYEPRRDGDPAILVANSAMAKKKLGWNPRYTEFSDIVEHAWIWEKRKWI